MTFNALNIHEARNFAANMQPLVNAEYVDMSSNRTYTVRSVSIFPYNEYERLCIASLYYHLVRTEEASALQMVELFMQTNPISDFDVVITAAPKDDASPHNIYITSLLSLVSGTVLTKKQGSNLS